MFSASQTRKKFIRTIAALVIAASFVVPMSVNAADSDIQPETQEVYQYISKNTTWLRSSQKSVESNKIVKISKGRYVQVTGDDGNGWGYAVCMAEDGNIYGGWISLYQFELIGFAPPEANLAPPCPSDNLRKVGKLQDAEEELEPPPMPKDSESFKAKKTTETQPATPPMPKEEVLGNPPMPTDVPSSSSKTTTSVSGVPADVQKSETKKKVWNYLTNTLGFNRAAACAIMVNIKEESGFRPTSEIVDTNGEISIGLFQWNGDRCEAFKTYCDARSWEYGSVDAQLAYLKYELNNPRYRQYQKMLSFENSASGCYDASYYWASVFEVCAKNRWEARAEAAKEYYQQ